MKNIIKIKFHRSKFLALFAFSLIIISCEDYLDVDTDTDNPVEAPIALLLPNIETGVSNTGNFNFYTGDLISVYTHQTVAREEQDQYGVRPSNILLNNEWQNTYLTLTDIESLISQATEEDHLMYLGVTQILKAYLISTSVDLWGDIPYTEAGQLEDGTVSTPFDDQEVIYQDALNLIDSGKENIQSGEGLEIGSEDLYYGGDMSQWIRFANTLKLKLYNQIKTTSLFNQADFDVLINENDFFTSSQDDFQFTHTSNQSPTDERNQFFIASYGGTQFSYYQSPWFYEILKGWNPDIHNSNEDPRIPYYFVNQLVPGELPPDQGTPETGNPNADYWDANSGFFSIRFGSVGPNRDHSVENSTTYPGIFPCGGSYDDGTGPTIDINSGTGVAPHRILTYDEFLYIQAELIQEGYISGDPGEKLEEAITASFVKVDEVVAGTGTTQDVPVLSGSTEVSDFIDNIMTEFDVASDDKKLEVIMTQKWVATFGDPIDQYTDYRRTGYPVLANPEGNSPEYQLDNGDGFPLDDSFTVLNNQFQRSMFWPQRELNLNQNAPAQKSPANYTIFWDTEN